MYFIWNWFKLLSEKKKTGLPVKLAMGMSLGLLLASKFSSVAIFGVLGVIFFWAVYRGELPLKTMVLDWIVASLTALMVIWVCYQFTPLTGYYIIGLKNTIGGILTGRSAFLMGHYSTSGWLYYFPAVFLLKTPIPLILLLGCVFFFKEFRNRQVLIFALLPAAVYFAMSCVSKVQIGQRHILPVYPFVFLLASGVFSFTARKPLKIVFLFLLLWYAAGTLKAKPWYISYFNESTGPDDNGYLYLTDSNLDWGQGLKELGAYLKQEKVSGIYLNYFGTADPHYYGIKYLPFGMINTMGDSNATIRARGLRAGDNIDFSAERKVLFAISATNLQATYYADKDIFSWLKKIKPDKIIAHSIFVYNMTDHTAEYGKLKAMTHTK